MPWQHLCQANDTRLGPDFGKNGCVPVILAVNAAWWDAWWVALRAIRSLSDLAQIPKEDIQTLEQLWLSLTMPQQHLCQGGDTRVGTPGWTLILAKMGVFLAVDAAWWDA